MEFKKWARTSINELIQLGRTRILPAALLVAVMAYVPAARAGGVVSGCDETSLRTALSGGGSVTFSFVSPCTITLSSTITIFSDTTINGIGQSVTISGGGLVEVLNVPTGVKLHLNKLMIANGVGGIFNQGTLTVTNSTFSGNYSGAGAAAAPMSRVPYSRRSISKMGASASRRVLSH